MLQFVPGGTHPDPEFLKNGDYLQGTVAANPLQLLTNLEGNIGEAISSVAGAGNDIGLLARRLNGMIDTNGDQFGRIINKTERSIDSFQTDDARHQRRAWATPTLRRPTKTESGSRRTGPVECPMALRPSWASSSSRCRS